MICVSATTQKRNDGPVLTEDCFKIRRDAAGDEADLQVGVIDFGGFETWT